MLMLRSGSKQARPQIIANRVSFQLHRWQTSTSNPPETPNPHPPLSSLPPSPPHHDLPSFLAYAQRTSLSPTSTTYVGTSYEYLCRSTLSRLSLSLTRTGGRSDHGIDLLGHWTLPSLPYPLRVLVQCKALKAKAGPNLIRELEGAFAGAPAGWRGAGTVAMLVTTREATKGVREAVARSQVPAVWVMVEDLREGVGRVRQVLWNEMVGKMGLEGVGVQVRYLPVQKGEEVEKEVVLTWKGEVWEPSLEAKERGGLISCRG
ncbi:hypothetical protein MMC08_001334 [Hypocenomyce scalaris]|nr:hypothetical protein [Hypocenomyce scalaris]